MLGPIKFNMSTLALPHTVSDPIAGKSAAVESAGMQCFGNRIVQFCRQVTVSLIHFCAGTFNALTSLPDLLELI